MNNVLLQFKTVLDAMIANLPFVLMIIGGLWLIQIINRMTGYRLNRLGVYPRNRRGLIGIVFSPVLHGDFAHLFFNSIPLFVFLSFVLLSGQVELYCITAVIILLSGILLWLFGRRAIHIGSSSLIMGYLGYLLVNAYYSPSAITIVIAIVCVYYFGGLLLGLLPGEEKVSWEGHIFGFIAGIVAAYLCPLLTS